MFWWDWGETLQPQLRDSCSEQMANCFILQIMNETALLPVAFFPHLKQLTFHNNPLTTTHSGTVWGPRGFPEWVLFPRWDRDSLLIQHLDAAVLAQVPKEVL